MQQCGRELWCKVRFFCSFHQLLLRILRNSRKACPIGFHCLQDICPFKQGFAVSYYSITLSKSKLPFRGFKNLIKSQKLNQIPGNVLVFFYYYSIWFASTYHQVRSMQFTRGQGTQGRTVCYRDLNG